MVMAAAKVSSVFLFLFGFYTITEAILCYQCHDSKNDGTCLTYTRTLRNNHVKWNEKKRQGKPFDNLDIPFGKNCSTSKTPQPYCFIERVEHAGNINSYIRGCTDGITFSYNISQYEQFKQMDKDNGTTCVYIDTQDGQISNHRNLVCISMCKTDFCNGPLAAAALSSSVITLAILLVFGRLINM